MSEQALQTILQAYQAAKESGDEEAALRFAQMAQQLQAQMAQQAPQQAQQQEPDSPGYLSGLAREVAQGATFGWSDELEAMMRGGDYEENLARIRAQQQQFKEQNPWSAGVGELAGAVAVPGVAAAKGLHAAAKAVPRAAKAITENVPRWARWGTVGAGEGALYGAGAAEEDRLAGAAEGAALAGGVGAVAPKAIEVGKRILTPLWKAVSSTPKGTAEGLVREALERSNLTPDEAMAALRDMGDDAMLADLSPYLQSLMYQTQRGVSASRGDIHSALKARRGGDQASILTSAREELGVDPDNFAAFMDELDAARADKAAPFYKRAHAQSVPQTEELLGILDRVPEAAYKELHKIARARGDDLDAMPDVEKLDYVKRGLDSLIDKAFSGGDSVSKTYGRELMQVRSDLLDYVDNAVPDFAKARGIYAGASRLMDAAKFGRNVFKADEDEIIELVRKMGDSERLAFRQGFARAIRDRVERAGETGNAVKRLINSTGTKRIIRAAFDDEEQADRFLKKLSDRLTMNETYDVALGGSQTHDRFAAEYQLEDWSTPAGFIRRFVSTNPMEDDATNRMLGNLLMGRQVPGASSAAASGPYATGATVGASQGYAHGAPGGLLRVGPDVRPPLLPPPEQPPNRGLLR